MSENPNISNNDGTDTKLTKQNKSSKPGKQTKQTKQAKTAKQTNKKDNKPQSSNSKKVSTTANLTAEAKTTTTSNTNDTSTIAKNENKSTSNSMPSSAGNTSANSQNNTKPANSQPSAAGKSQGQFSASDLNRIVLEYLNKKGYHQTEAMLREESTVKKGKLVADKTKELKKEAEKKKEKEKESEKLEKAKIEQEKSKKRDLAGNVISYQQIHEETAPDSYMRSYKLLKEWIDSSLEMYKDELNHVLYPVFIYVFLKLVSKSPIHARGFFDKYSSDFRAFHSTELNRLFSVNSKDHIKENEIAYAFYSNRYRVTISRTTLNLLLFYLNDNVNKGGSLIISILNEYIEPNAVETVTSKDRLNDGVKIISDKGKSSLDTEINTTPVKLGRLPQDEEFIKEIETELKILDEKEKQAQQNSTDTSKIYPSTSLLEEFHALLSESYAEYFDKKRKEMAGITDINDKKVKSSSAFSQAPSMETLPLPPKNALDLKIEIQKVKESRDSIPLNDLSAELPSVCMYTFQNTNGEMLSLDYSNDCRLVAAGFKDSYIKIWSLDGSTLESNAIKLKQPKPVGSASIDSTSNKINDKSELEDAPITTTKLIGHSGAIYSTSFSPDNKLLISASGDKTVRLWSMDTCTTLVNYKGHNHPVWDLEFSPVGHYFVTASHDQTARLWSCDHIYPLRIFSGHISDVDCVTFHPNGCYVFTGSSDKTCRMWDVSTGESVRLFVGHTAPISSASVSPHGKWIATGSEDGVILVWDIGTGKVLKKLIGHGRSAIHSLSYNKESNVLVSGGSDDSVRVWDLMETKNKSTFHNDIETEYNEPVIGYFGNPIPSITQDLKDFGKNNTIIPTTDLVASFYTKNSPIYKVKFTRSNLIFAGGALRD